MDDLDPATRSVSAATARPTQRARHDVDGERSDVGRADDPADRERRPQLLVARFEILACREVRRQRGVDEAGGDEVDPNRGELVDEPTALMHCAGGRLGRSQDLRRQVRVRIRLSGSAHTCRRQRAVLLTVVDSLWVGRITRKTEFVAFRVSKHVPNLPVLVSSRWG
jgi:hypothetical protein